MLRNDTSPLGPKENWSEYDRAYAVQALFSDSVPQSQGQERAVSGEVPAPLKTITSSQEASGHCGRVFGGLRSTAPLEQEAAHGCFPRGAGKQDLKITWQAAQRV